KRCKAMHLTVIVRPVSCKSGMTQKLIRVMKLTAVFLLAACLQVAARSNAQNVTISVKNTPLKEVFRQIQKQTGMNIMVKESLLEKAGKISIDVKNMPVDNVLQLCLKDLPLNYKIEAGVIVIREKQVEPNAETVPIPPIDVHGRIINENDEPVAATVT